MPAAEFDRDKDLLAVIRNEDTDRSAKYSDRISLATMMGTMPKADRILKSGLLWKLTSKFEWKPLQVALTTAGLFMAREDEETLRDMIPLYEIVEVARRRDIPGDAARKLHANLNGDREPSSSLEEGGADRFLVQLRTVADGYNSGRTYYLDARSEAACADWFQLLRATADRARLLKQARSLPPPPAPSRPHPPPPAHHPAHHVNHASNAASNAAFSSSRPAPAPSASPHHFAPRLSYHHIGVVLLYRCITIASPRRPGPAGCGGCGCGCTASTTRTPSSAR
jgi:hypothetical protein